MSVRPSVTHVVADLTDVTLADEDTNSKLTDNANRTIQDNVSTGNALTQPGGQLWNQCKWRHLVAKFVTDASGASCWPNLEPMPVAFFLSAEEITQVKEAIPWVRCASGNVF